MYSFKINKMIFKNGVEISPGCLTIIVGPNNSGKSRILKDLLSLGSRENSQTTIVQNIEYPIPTSFREVVESYNIRPNVDKLGNYELCPLPSNMSDPTTQVLGQINWDDFCSTKLDDPVYRQKLRRYFGNYFMTFLNTEDRLKLLNQSTFGAVDMRRTTMNLIHLLYKEGIAKEKLLNILIKEAFNKEVKLDYSALNTMLLRVADDFNGVPSDMREAFNSLEKYETLDDQGDGLKSFAATALAMIVVARPVLLIDEPEAFLHPPQAMRIGEIIADYSTQDHQIIVASHSADLLRGILAKRQDIQVMRIERNKNCNEINPIDAADLDKINKDPLLSSSRILDSIFYKGSVITEGDTDSTFYQRVARRVRNLDDIHYANAFNKQTVSRMAEPFVKLGIRFAAIVDFDILNDATTFEKIVKEMGMGGDDLESSLKMVKKIIQEIESKDASRQRDDLITALEQLGIEARKEYVSTNPLNDLVKLRIALGRLRDKSSVWDTYKANGFNALPSHLWSDFYQLDILCKKYGLFIVPCGEVESWLKNYGVNNKKSRKWIEAALIGLDSIDVSKTPLGEFISRIHEHLLHESC